MGFFQRLSNGWQLAKMSLSTINENRSLLLFPVLSTISLILILISFFGGGYYLVGDQIEAAFADEQTGNVLGIALLFTYYLINFFIIVFFNSALIHCAMKIFNGEETSVGDGISYAFSRIGNIFGWAVVAATVGTLLRILQESGKIGEFVGALIGIAWSVMTFFVVPIIVYEDRGIFEAIKKSGQMMREKWGESIGANMSLGGLQLLGFLVAGFVGFLLSSISPMLGIIVGGALAVINFTVFSAAQTVFIAAVYNHLNDRPTGDFDGNTLDAAFIQRS